MYVFCGSGDNLEKERGADLAERSVISVQEVDFVPLDRIDRSRSARRTDADPLGAAFGRRYQGQRARVAHHLGAPPLRTSQPSGRCDVRQPERHRHHLPRYPHAPALRRRRPALSAPAPKPGALDLARPASASNTCLDHGPARSRALPASNPTFAAAAMSGGLEAARGSPMRGWPGCERRTAAREGGSGTGRPSRDNARWRAGMARPVANRRHRRGTRVRMTSWRSTTATSARPVLTASRRPRRPRRFPATLVPPDAASRAHGSGVWQARAQVWSPWPAIPASELYARRMPAARARVLRWRAELWVARAGWRPLGEQAAGSARAPAASERLRSEEQEHSALAAGTSSVEKRRSGWRSWRRWRPR
jgi:hypothetical protein